MDDVRCIVYADDIFIYTNIYLIRTEMHKNNDALSKKHLDLTYPIFYVDTLT